MDLDRRPGTDHDVTLTLQREEDDVGGVAVSNVPPVPRSGCAPLEAAPPAVEPGGPSPRASGFRWWMPNVALAATATCLSVIAIRADGQRAPMRTGEWWALTAGLHLPLLIILVFLLGGVVERLGYFWRGRTAEPGGLLPPELPTVCVQLPMFNEHAVAVRVIEAACAMTWPVDRLSVQVLDDSTDDDTRALVDEVCAFIRQTSGVDCHVLRRADRQGYKAGALEAGRVRTDAEFLAIFDADFVPPQDFLLRAIPHFYGPDGVVDEGLALVQAQWGHLNADESALTRAQSLWVDDHHTLQMSWRSAMWRFVNFTGTAGVWRASAVEKAGGWRSASLVEDCELSFRHLFAGFRTTFVKEIVAPAELPATYTAYKAQQKRWTQGWVQLQRMHLATLLFRFPCSTTRRIHFAYHMCVSWQWLVWALWITMLPLMIRTGLWFGSLGVGVGLALYALPCALWIGLAATIASLETKHTYTERMVPEDLSASRRADRAIPRHQHRHAPAPVQRLHRRPLRSASQRIRAHPEDRGGHHCDHLVRCAGGPTGEARRRRQGALALRDGRGVLRRLSVDMGGGLPR
jgi:cellulose synthase/poly-beta-1,6-N-acetylglucosamine synthase-like glycosyltransferase